MKRLIVTADDFGAAREVNEAVEHAHRDGILTAASLMATAPAAGEAVALARRMPSLRVGLHLVLVEGRPALPARDIPDLVGTDAMFRTDMARAGVAMFFRPAVRRQLATEIEAQFRAFAETGLALDHVNAHKHFHLHPTIAGLILRIGGRYGLKAARVPLEPSAPLRAADPATPLSPAYLTGPWAHLLRRRYRKAGLLIPDHVFGLRWSGAMSQGRLARLISHLPDGLSEVYLHPATSGGFAGAAPRYRYAEELAELTSEHVIEAVTAHGVARGGFTDFLPAATALELAQQDRHE